MKIQIPRFSIRLALVHCIVLLLSLILLQSSSHRAWASLEAEVLYARGSSEYLAGKYEEARSTLAQAAILEPQHSDIRLALGLCHLALQQYQEAYRSFRIALFLNPLIKGGQLYLGISLYHLERYQEAQAALLKAREQDPEEGLTHYYFGLVEMQLAHPQQSLQALRKGYRLSPEYAAHFKPYENLLLTPTDVRIKKLRQEFMVGFNYDSNVENHTDPYYLSPGRKAPKHTDWAFVFGSRTEYYPVLRNKFNLGFRLDGYYNKHLYLESWDFLNLRGEAFLNWQAGPILVKPFSGIDRTLYGSDSSYSTFYVYGLTMNWPETDFLRGELTYRARDKQFHYERGFEYFQAGWDHQIHLSQGLFLPPWGIVRAGLFYNRDLAKGVFWASKTYGVTLDGVVFFPWEVTGWLNFEYGYNPFDNVDKYWEKRHRDHIYRLQLLVKKPITPSLACWLGYGYWNVRSNISEWQFSRALAQVMFTWNLF